MEISMKRIATLTTIIALIAMCAPMALAAGDAANAEPGAKTGKAPNLVKNGDAETGDVTNWLNLKELDSEAPHSGKKCFKAVGAANIFSAGFIPVDTAKTYMLTGWFKSTGEQPSNIYFGLVPFSAKKRQIAPVFVNIIKGTETTLAEACTKESKLLKIADGAKWKIGPFASIAFEADDSGEYKDLPNRNVTGYGIEKVEQNADGVWEVHLKKPCGKDYPAGTKIREHRSGGTYIYTGGRGKVPGEWKEFTGAIGGESPFGVSADKFWKGTRYVRILILANHNQKKDATLLIDDIKLVEVPTPEVKAE
jgi:hypothetical protein